MHNAHVHVHVGEYSCLLLNEWSCIIIYCHVYRLSVYHALINVSLPSPPHVHAHVLLHIRLCGVCSDLRDGVEKASAAYGHASSLIVSNDFTLLKVQSYMYIYTCT